MSFIVEDDGVGFDPATAARGAGLTNLADRVAAVGGTLEDRRPSRPRDADPRRDPRS